MRHSSRLRRLQGVTWKCGVYRLQSRRALVTPQREREMVVQASRVMFLGWGVSNPFEGILTIAAYVLRGYIYILVLYNIYIIRYTSLGHRAESKLYLIFDLMLLGFLRFLAPSRLRPCRTARRHHPKTASPRHREKKINCPWR